VHICANLVCCGTVVREKWQNGEFLLLIISTIKSQEYKWGKVSSKNKQTFAMVFGLALLERGTIMRF